VSASAAPEPWSLPHFVIDFDQPASTRYNKVFTHFREDLIQMENYWYSVIPGVMHDFFGLNDHLERYEAARKD